MIRVPALRSCWVWLPPMVALVLYVAIHQIGGNRSLFLMLNHAGQAFGDSWWIHLTLLGDGAVALALVLPTIRKSPQRFWALLIAALIVVIWAQVCKKLMPIPRPLGALPTNEFFQSGPKLRAVSFPSGHAAAIFTLCGVWIMTLPGRYVLRLLLLLLATLVALSRIMVGVHWPLDVLAGMLGGWVSAYAGLWMSARWKCKTSGICGLIAGIVLLAIAAGLLFSRHTELHAALALQRALGLVCLMTGIREICLMFLRFQPRVSAVGEGDANDTRIT